MITMRAKGGKSNIIKVLISLHSCDTCPSMLLDCDCLLHFKYLRIKIPSKSVCTMYCCLLLFISLLLTCRIIATLPLFCSLSRFHSLFLPFPISHILHFYVDCPLSLDSGLGTSTSAEAKEYFSNLQTHEIDFTWDNKVTLTLPLTCLSLPLSSFSAAHPSTPFKLSNFL